MRVRHAPLSALALAAALAAGGAGSALAQQPTTPTPRSPSDTARSDTTRRAPTTTRSPSGGVTRDSSAGAVMRDSAMAPSTGMAAPIVASLRTDAHALALLHESNRGEVEAGKRAVREASDSAVRAFAQMMVSEHGALDTQGMALGARLGVTPALPDSQLPQLQQSELQALPGGTGAGASAMPGASPTKPSGGGVSGAVSGAASGAVTGAASGAATGAAAGSATGVKGAAAGAGKGAVGGAVTGAQTGAVKGMTPTTPRPDSSVASKPMAGAAAGANDFDRAYVAQQVIAHQRTLAIVDAAIARASQSELKSALQSQVRPAVQQHLQMAQTLQARLGG